MIFLNLFLRILLALFAAYAFYATEPGMPFTSLLVIFQGSFLATLSWFPVPWLKLIMPKDIGLARARIPLEEIGVQCGKDTLSGGCLLYVASKHVVSNYLEIAHKRALRKAEQIQEDLNREFHGIMLGMGALLVVSVTQHVTGANSVAQANIFEVMAACMVFFSYIGRLYGEVSSERKINIESVNLI